MKQQQAVELLGAFQEFEAFLEFGAFQASEAFQASGACLEFGAFQASASCQEEPVPSAAWRPAVLAAVESGFGRPSAAVVVAAIRRGTGFLPLLLRQLLAEEHCGERRGGKWGKSAAAGTRNGGSCGGRCGCREAF